MQYAVQQRSLEPEAWTVYELRVYGSGILIGINIFYWNRGKETSVIDFNSLFCVLLQQSMAM